MKTILVLVVFALAPALLLFVTGPLVAWISRGWGLWIAHSKHFVRSQLAGLSASRSWTTAHCHILATVLFIHSLTSRIDLIWTTLALLLYVFIVIALSLSVLAATPFFQRLWDEAAIKLAVLSAPIPMLYLAKGYAGLWIGEMLRTSAANVPMTHVAATCFVLMVPVALCMLLCSLGCELAVLFVSSSITGKSSEVHQKSLLSLLWSLDEPANPRDRIRLRRWSSKAGLLALFTVSLVAFGIASKAAILLPTSKFGGVVLQAIAFDFDGVPASRCKLDAKEEKLAEGDEPFVKAIFLAGTQEKALLVQRLPGLYRPSSIREINDDTSGERSLKIIRVVTCH